MKAERILIFFLGVTTVAFAASDPPEEYPKLSIKLGDPQKGVLKPEEGWVCTESHRLLNLRIILERESVDTEYDPPRYRGTEDPDPALFKQRGPANVIVSVYQIAESDPKEVPIRTRLQGGGQDLREYSSIYAFHILYPQAERLTRLRKAVQEMSRGREVTKEEESALLAYFELHFVDMPPGNYVIRATYAPKKDEMWPGTRTAELKLRVEPSVRDEQDEASITTNGAQLESD